MKWFKQKIAQWANEGSDMSTNANSQSPGLVSNRKSSYADGDCGSDTSFKNPLNITLYNAVGGRIVKFHSYNRKTDQMYETTYIIPSDEDFEKALGQFITLEAIKHTSDE